MRKEGYYWVKFKDSEFWEIMYYVEKGRCFKFGIDSNQLYDIGCFEEIDEQRITKE
jgi:hypothetical protein